MITIVDSVVDMKDCGDKAMESEITPQEVFRPGDIVTVTARMWPGNVFLRTSQTRSNLLILRMISVPR